MGTDLLDDVDQPNDQEEQTGRPADLMSLGARLGARTPLQPSPDAAQAKVDQTQTPPPPPDIKLDPGAMPPGIVRSTLKPNEIPTPAASSPATTTLPSLMQRRSELSAPIDPNATDASGKKIYRMGWKQRLAGAVADFGAGFNRQQAPVYIGPGATNARYAHDVGQQQQRLGAVDTDIANQEKLAESQRKLYDDATKQAYEGQLGDARTALANAAESRAKTAGQLADVKSQLVDTQNQLNQARANKANQKPEPKTDVEVALAYRDAVMKGDKQSAEKYKGALDTLEQLKRAGRDTSASDVAKAIEVAEYRGRETDRVNQQKEQERQRRYAELDKNVTLKYNPAALAAEKQKIDQELDTKYAGEYQRVNDDADAMLGLTKSGGKLRRNQPGNKGAPQEIAKPPKPKAAPPAGRAWVYDRKTGKPGTVPISQLGLVRKSTQYGTW